ncbi:type VI secretion system tip protein VgrG [Herbaspirillum seropedicae]|uniref:VGR-related protein n=1 Tax=Herbaspirillum seropedicae (strain SmR1) TaxID=757424 RepID=D8IW07_HERSS|nr:type VI secretion system Vgr family protein [Herbaspirillum seropedicae]ADJ61805.1 VGR-related protein [Herbaspirillum seropedicae SmR1]UMU19912.1 type VI secretion system tip protein VgrG [Herbaspirillum seropedicae]
MLTMTASSMTSASFGAFLNLLTHERRLLRLHLPSSAPSAVQRLVALQVTGTEAVCGNVIYRVQCASSAADLDIHALQGVPIGFSVKEGDGGAALVCGLATSVRQIHSEAGAVLLEIELCDALRLLEQRKTWRVFCDLSVLEISEQILTEHRHDNSVLAAALRWHVSGLHKAYPKRAFVMQAGESDADFLQRLWRQEGIAWHFRFALEGNEPVHHLHLADHPSAYPDHSAVALRFHQAGVMEQTDTVTHWEAWCEQSIDEVTLTAFDYKANRCTQAQEKALRGKDGAGLALARTLEDYEYAPPVLAAGLAHQQQMARRRIEAHELAAQGCRARSVVRSLRAGTVFRISGHPHLDTLTEREARFTVTQLTLYARNSLVLDAEWMAPLMKEWLPARAALGDQTALDLPVYCNGFDCVQSDTAIVPRYDPEDVPKLGLMSAVVVGDGDKEVDVDELGRIAVRFLFTRPQEHPRGRGASGTTGDSARIRILQPWADAGFGTAFWPRVGSEILIAFLQNHPDKPVALGGLYDGTHYPPKFSRQGKLPENSALSGIRSKELKANRHNHLLFDDSRGQISAQMFSDHAATQLNQGWLGSPRTEGRSAPRGEGFELATDAAGCLRTAHGLLITAFARLNASGNQLAREETLALMQQCVQLFTGIGEYAAQHQAKAGDHAPHERLHRQLQQWENGSNTKPDAGDGGAPVVAVTAPAGLHFSTPETAVTHAGENCDTVALRHIQLASGEHLTANAGKGISLFAQSEDLTLIAHQGELKLQSQHNDTKVAAAKNLSLTASGGKVQIIAADEILLAASDGSYLRLGGGKIDMGCSGAATIHAATHRWIDAQTTPGELPTFAKDDVGRKPVLARPTDDQKIAGVRFEIDSGDGGKTSGQTNDLGRAASLSKNAFEQMRIRFLDSDD